MIEGASVDGLVKIQPSSYFSVGQLYRVINSTEKRSKDQLERSQERNRQACPPCFVNKIGTNHVRDGAGRQRLLDPWHPFSDGKVANLLYQEVRNLWGVKNTSLHGPVCVTGHNVLSSMKVMPRIL